MNYTGRCVRTRMGVKAALPRYEVYLYTAVLGVAMAWAASWIVEASSGELRPTFNVDVSPSSLDSDFNSRLNVDSAFDLHEKFSIEIPIDIQVNTIILILDLPHRGIFPVCKHNLTHDTNQPNRNKNELEKLQNT